FSSPVSKSKMESLGKCWSDQFGSTLAKPVASVNRIDQLPAGNFLAGIGHVGPAVGIEGGVALRAIVEPRLGSSPRPDDDRHVGVVLVIGSIDHLPAVHAVDIGSVIDPLPLEVARRMPGQKGAGYLEGKRHKAADQSAVGVI